MSVPTVNLARRAFANSRPVSRLALLLWLAGAVFCAGNLWLYWDFVTGSGDAHRRLGEVEAAVQAAETRIEKSTAQLVGFDLGQQNEEIEYLNARISERRFSWGRLLDRLARILPDRARLKTLAPTAGRGSRASSTRAEEAARQGQMLLAITGEAKTGEAILDFVDTLYADPAFGEPNLAGESVDLQGLLGFRLSVPYDPNVTDDVRITGEPFRGEPASAPMELETK